MPGAWGAAPIQRVGLHRGVCGVPPRKVIIMNLPSSIEVVKALRTRAPRNRLPQLPIEQALPYAIAYLREEITGFELLALIWETRRS